MPPVSDEGPFYSPASHVIGRQSGAARDTPPSSALPAIIIMAALPKKDGMANNSCFIYHVMYELGMT
jgi:hypothetical protein